MHGLYSNLSPLGNRGALGLKGLPPGGSYIRNSRKGLSHDARSMSVLMGRAIDLVKFERELDSLSLNSLKSHYIISQIVSSLLIHFI